MNLIKCGDKSNNSKKRNETVLFLKYCLKYC